MAGASPSSAQKPHIAIFPFMSKGHTIPLLHLAHLLHHRRLASVITVFTTPLNSPFIRNFLSGIEPDIIELSFPDDIPDDLPPNIESTDRLPSMLLFLPFIQAVKKLQPQFEQALKNLPTINLLISDGFLGWSGESSAKFGIPRMVFYGMGSFAMTVSGVVAINKPHKHVSSYDDPFTVTPFPHLKLTKADLNPPFDDPDPKGPHHEFVMEQGIAAMQSQGMLVNSFLELDEIYLDYWNNNCRPKSWCVGPLCVMAKHKIRLDQSSDQQHQRACMQWLDARSASNRPVLYAAFGSQAKVAPAQLREIAAALEKSELDFLWVIKDDDFDFGEFEENVKDRGMVVGKWVDQMEILSHDSVKGFMSHCGWNSVMESVVAGVPMLAWPMMAEQPLNAKFVVEEIKVGLRIRSTRGIIRDENEEVVGRDHIEEMVRELMAGEGGKEVARNMKVLSEKARMSMEHGGSSWTSLETSISQVSSINAIPSHD